MLSFKMEYREKSQTAWNTPLNKAIKDMKLGEEGEGKQRKRDEARRIAVPKRKLANKEQ